jgi:thiol-disulfide isomerase/thioredoxin
MKIISMKKVVVLIALVCSIVAVVKAQNGALKQMPLTEKTVVKDPDGTVYPYVVWRKLLATGDYSLSASRAKATDSLSYVLAKRTQAEKEAFAARLPKPAESTVFKVGEMLKPIKDRDIKGEKFDTKSLTGKVIVLNFWFINCPPCRQEIPDLNNLVEAYKDNKDVVFIAIALDEKYDIDDFLKTQPFNYRIVENGRYHASRVGLNLYPTNVVVDKGGKIVFSSVSNQPANPIWMRKAINEALADKTKQAAL